MPAQLLTCREALAAIKHAKEVHVCTTAFDVGDYVQVTKRVAYDLIQRRMTADSRVRVEVTHDGAKLWIESNPRADALRAWLNLYGHTLRQLLLADEVDDASVGK